MASSQKPEQLFDELASTWWDEAGVLRGLGVLLDPVRIPFIVDVLRVELGSGPRDVLDLGAGGGSLSEALARLGLSVVALDPSLPSVQAGKEHGARVNAAVSFLVGRGEQLPFPDTSFDAVLCMETLEHVADPLAVVAESSRVLRPGGIFMFSGPNRTAINRFGLVFVAQDLLGVVPRGTHEWKRLLRPEEMERHMRRSGIDPARIDGVGLKWRSLSQAVVGVAGLAARRLSYPDAARRIHLVAGTGTSLAYQGFGRKQTSGVA